SGAHRRPSHARSPGSMTPETRSRAPERGERRASGDLHVRRATPQDEPALLELLRASMGEEAVAWSSAYWRWKHDANPFGPSPVLVAEDAGRLVGLRAFMRWAWRSGGAVAPALR